MYSADVLSQLRTLNWLAQEARLLVESSPQRIALDSQIEKLRSSLPLSLLKYHDERARRKVPSVTKLSGSSSCGNCHLKLPSGTLSELAHSGCFGVCSNCGIFIWSDKAERATDAATAAAAEAEKTLILSKPKAKAKPRTAKPKLSAF